MHVCVALERTTRLNTAPSAVRYHKIDSANLSIKGIVEIWWLVFLFQRILKTILVGGHNWLCNHNFLAETVIKRVSVSIEVEGMDCPKHHTTPLSLGASTSENLQCPNQDLVTDMKKDKALECLAQCPNQDLVADMKKDKALECLAANSATKEQED